VDELWFYYCIDDISFMWDQWMGCTITCTHGRYRGVSQGYNNAMEESLSNAKINFMKDSDKHDWED
jgi:hypothetical protein